jgi:hypothetical protein
VKYDPSLPLAVFLGPSLDMAIARQILPANYYPPVRMGDIYRLVTCGVRLIVIIDGVFHSTSPVWQREIVAAINNGVTVVGASSMGALRAIELEALGMIGLGTVVEWYRSGRIAGDDEVALQHADGEYGYRALSEPLVNIRWNLDRAAIAGVISAAENEALTAAMHALDHSRRSYPALLETAAFTSLAPAGQTALRTFLSRESQNLKQQDAKTALTWCAERLPQLVEPPARVPFAGRTIRRLDEVMQRGIPAPGHALPTLESLLLRAAADAPRTQHIVNHASRRFYLLNWAARAGVRLPQGEAAAFEQRWIAQHAVTDRSAWLVANGLTEDELRRELDARALAAWLLDGGPQAVGLDRPFLEAWADQMGIEPPDGVVGSEAFRAWMVQQTPNYFGFDQWHADVEFARELQLSGDVARLAADYRAGPPAAIEMRADRGARAL